MGNVQISQELFMQLIRFHLVEDESCEKEIKKGLAPLQDARCWLPYHGCRAAQSRRHRGSHYS